jgi:TatD DNase family protein
VSVRLVDSHCHLDFDALSADIDGVLARCADNDVERLVTICTRVHLFEQVAAIAEKYDNVYCSVGTHPHNAGDELDVTTATLVELAGHPKCVAIGEAGLDYHYDNSPRDAQALGFRRHIAAARETGLPLVVHTRDADADTAEILEDEAGKGAFPFVLHCFSAGAELAERGLKLGGYVSFSGIVTFNNAAEIRQVAKAVPLNRILVETDAPYLAPVPHRGRPNQPAWVRHTAETVAELRGMDLETFAAATTANFDRLFAKAASP